MYMDRHTPESEDNGQLGEQHMRLCGRGHFQHDSRTDLLLNMKSYVFWSTVNRFSGVGQWSVFSQLYFK